MEIPNYYKNISFSNQNSNYRRSRVHAGVVSKTLAQNDAVSVTLFAFEKGGETG